MLRCALVLEPPLVLHTLVPYKRYKSTAPTVITSCVSAFYLPLLVSTFISYASNFLIQARKLWQNEQETNTALNVSKYVTFSGLSVFSPNAGKNGPEKPPYLDTFHAAEVTGTTNAQTTFF